MFDKQIILGSASPRRKQLVESLGVPVTTRKIDVDETYPEDLDIYQVPSYLAKLKANSLKSEIKNNEVLITSDTIVIHQNQILGKPHNREEAIAMLQRLSNNMHEVVSGVNLYSSGKESVFSVKTNVYFKAISLEEITYYVDHFKPFDKAGAYGIQEWIGMIGIQKIEGCYYNVMGLPTQRLWEELTANFS